MNLVQYFDGAAADVWSLGAVLHVMLYNRLPDRKNLEVLKRSLEPGDLPRELLSLMLVLNPKERLSIKVIANHEWVLASQIRGSMKTVASGVNKMSLYVDDARKRARGRHRAAKDMPKSTSLTSLSSLASKDSDLGSTLSI